MKIENTKAQMRKGVLEYCILGILSNGDAYASDIIEHLKNAELIVVDGTSSNDCDFSASLPSLFDHT